MAFKSIVILFLIFLPYYAISLRPIKKLPIIALLSSKDNADDWKCIAGIQTPIRLNKHGDIECLSTDHHNCLWDDEGRVSACQEFVKTTTNPDPLICGTMHQREWGGNGYDTPNHWCQKGRKLLGSKASEADYLDKWKCIAGIQTPIRLNKDGDVECLSTDHHNCLWDDEGRVSVCQEFVKEVINPDPLVCGAMHRKEWGGTGYDTPNHWCQKGRKLLGTESNKGDTNTTVARGPTATVPLKLPKKRKITLATTILPSVWQIANGVQIKVLKPMAAIFQLSYDSKSLSNDENYRIPKGTQVIDINRCSFYTDTYTSDNYLNIKKTDKTEVSVEGKYQELSGKLSETENKIRENLFTYNKSVSRSKALCILYDVINEGTMDFTSKFKSMLKALPKNFTTDTKSSYSKFFDYFGTHYSKKISLGGKLEQLYFTSNEYTKKYGLDKINQQATASFYITAKYERESEKEITQEYKINTISSKLEVTGGKPWSSSSSETWTTWGATIPDQPAIVHYQLEKISELISDPWLKENLEDAIDSYLGIPKVIIHNIFHPVIQ